MQIAARSVAGHRARLLAGASLLCAFATTAAAQAADPAEEVAEVVVTGSYLGNIRQEDRASPVLSIDTEAIAKTGVTSIGDLTRFIPQNVGSVGGLQDLAKGGADTRDTRSVNLRGLGAGATLTMLNGRRGR